MKKGVFIIILLSLTLLLMLLLPPVLAQNGKTYHLKLLAVQDNGDSYEGSDAELYLELKEGTGRVFLETFPLTKMDTQISTRFAKETACKYFNLDCNQHDFIFTIKAKSNIVGGPSAGAAISALTTIAVLDLDYDEKTTITGTINSGGIIGPVGGVKEKLEAASNISLKKILIAKGTSKQILPFPDEKTNQTNETKQIDDSTNENKQNETDEKEQINDTTPMNNTFNLINYGRQNLSLEIVEVMDLDEVLFELTGLDLNHKNITIAEDEEYTTIMKKLQEALCDRSEQIEKDIKRTNKTDLENSVRLRGLAKNATLEKDYYSAASYCFGSSIQLKNLHYLENKPSRNAVEKLFETLERKINATTQKLAEEKIETITDLQSLIVVEERLNDAQKQVDNFKEEKNESSLEELYALLAYGEERHYSAVSWMNFFEMSGKKFVLNQEVLSSSCTQKIIEAEERIEYARFFIGDDNVAGIAEKTDIAKMAAEKNLFALCLIKASEAKSDANAVLSSLGLSDENIDDYLQAKIKAASRVIAENTAQGMFPILGYSYFRYAQSLQEEQKINALIYLEYALDMSELSIYFPEEKSYLEAMQSRISPNMLTFIKGFAAGVLITLLLMSRRKKK